MEIVGDQIATQFKTYGTPSVVEDYLDLNDIDVATLSPATLPAHGVAAVKELMAYTTGIQIVMAIAAHALGQMDAPTTDANGDGHDDTTGEFVDGNREAADDDDDDGDLAAPAADYHGKELSEGLRVLVRLTDDEGGTIEGGGLAGEVETIERRGDKNYVSIVTDPEPGHTTGNLITVVDTNLELADG